MNAGQLIRYFLISVLFSISLGFTPPLTEAWQAVSAGGWHTCALRNDGTVACWGYNQDGQATPPPGTFTQLGAGEWNTCGVRTGGTLSCWGNNSQNQSIPPLSFLAFTQVTGGEFTSCASRSDGSVWCWGWDFPGIEQAVPPPGLPLSR